MKKYDFPRSLLHLFDTTSEGLWFMSRDNVVEFYNTPFYEQFAIQLEGSTMSDWLTLVHPDDRDALMNKVSTHQQDEQSTRVTSRYRVKNRAGHYLWIEATGLLVEQDGEYIMVGTHKNVSEAVFLNEYLAHMASHDSETGLYNRYKLLQDVPQLAEQGWLFVCCLTELHEAQRRIGQEATGRLVSNVVSVLDDLFDFHYDLYRVNADTLVFTTSQAMTPSQAMRLLRDIDAQFSEQSRLCELTFSSRLGLGAVPCLDVESASVLTQVFNLSEYTRLVESPVMYEGEYRQQIVRYFNIQDALDVAIESRQIAIALQPIVSAKTGDIVSFEALARWTHPTLGVVSPGEFIPMAEKLGRIHALGMVVLEKACQFLSEFDESYQARPLINVNVSAQQLIKPTFIEDVLNVVQANQLLPSRLVLEITESYLLESTTTIVDTLKALDEHGFKLSIDDFGAGMTAITSLFSLPLFQVKLDRALVIAAMNIPSCLKLVSHFCEYGQTHGIAIVAEGIENAQMFEKLKPVGVPYLQGYCLYRPLEAEVWLGTEVLI
ncbi:TPA: EAL domain-containing protein [Vibrio cholerae]|uniref:EAL domain-containing protein n=1 Tax=Vibrio cholerae TaxID=666 RepID=UPI0028947A98|nr:EAL domain-containing protein [Vibrio cholerae]ELI1752144.1 EAL domain-containing protein [Vibrio cholerae]ELJ8538351.1 EAL domain-containing protein [Vibrio cholerae]ELJ8579381.1 EAL domain-containing protein [Vibrio cholerae]MDV2372625.1 EAL domain-containing protein [Vibrio cholerae]HDZ3707970.1 EAL domain-containing protein [Vibrio cholerae]